MSHKSRIRVSPELLASLLLPGRPHALLKASIEPLARDRERLQRHSTGRCNAAVRDARHAWRWPSADPAEVRDAMTKRWTPQAKMKLVEQARWQKNRAAFAEANDVSIEELTWWIECWNLYGLAGLSARKLQAVMKRPLRRGGRQKAAVAQRKPLARVR